MSSIAGSIRPQERTAVAEYLGSANGNDAPPAKAYCTDRTVKFTNSKSVWNGWSPTATNARFQPLDAGGLSIEQIRRLKLKWAYGFSGDIVTFAQPTILGGHLFVGSAGGLVQALRADSGCLEWTYQAAGPVRAAIVATPLGTKHALLFGDQSGWFYSLEAESGALLWKKKLDAHDSARSTGGAAVYQGTVFVPVSSSEEGLSTNPEYPCCTFRGSVIAYRVSDGSQVWKTYTIREAPKRTGKSKTGTDQWGPSGASVWSAPTLDLKRGLLYVTTGDNFSTPATPLSDAVLALDLKTGQIVWSKQTTPGDVWNSACNQTHDCPGPDYDFGSSVILEHLDDGKDLLLAGQKSGVVYGLDPERKGELLWQLRVGKGGINGGVQWGMASDGQKVYAATSDVIRGGASPDPTDPRPLPVDAKQGGGLTAIRLRTGEKAWYASPVPCGPKPGCSPAQSAAVTAIPGVVFSGSLDGHMRAYTSEKGDVVWDFDTVREFETVNGVRANGGAINGPGVVVVGGMIYVTSGYGRNGALPGNVLLAFGPGD